MKRKELIADYLTCFGVRVFGTSIFLFSVFWESTMHFHEYYGSALQACPLGDREFHRCEHVACGKLNHEALRVSIMMFE